MKKENPTFPVSPGYLSSFIIAARPKTLIAAASPVLIGSSLASLHHPISFGILALCLGFSLFLQIGTNWANDYFDFIKGADNAMRKGPLRAVQAGWIAPLHMRNSAFGSFLTAFLFACPLILRIGLEFFPLALLCILLGIFYTGGKRPLGYLGLGDLLVFVFYGPIATSLTVLTQLGRIPDAAWISALIPGAFSCAILCINNLRDIESDIAANKMTLAARFGRRFGVWEYICCLAIGFSAPAILALSQNIPTFWFLFLLLPLAIQPLRIVLHKPDELNSALSLTAQLFTAITLLFCLCTYTLITFH